MIFIILFNLKSMSTIRDRQSEGPKGKKVFFSGQWRKTQLQGKTVIFPQTVPALSTHCGDDPLSEWQGNNSQTLTEMIHFNTMLQWFPNVSMLEKEKLKIQWGKMEFEYEVMVISFPTVLLTYFVELFSLVWQSKPYWSNLEAN